MMLRKTLAHQFQRQKKISYGQAIELLRQPDHFLMLMETGKGRQYFIVPHGRVENEIAEKIRIFGIVGCGRDSPPFGLGFSSSHRS